MSEPASNIEQSNPETAPDEQGVLAARRKKLQQLIELGHDPWGYRFDDRSWIDDIRQKQTAIQYVLEDGRELAAPK